MKWRHLLALRFGPRIMCWDLRRRGVPAAEVDKIAAAFTGLRKAARG